MSRMVFYLQELYSPGLPRKTEEYRTPLRAASDAALASAGEDHSRLGHHFPIKVNKVQLDLVR